MYANTKRTDAPVKSRRRGVGELLRGLVHATLDRLASPPPPPRHAPPEYYRFPWF
jgi:hypothetical protein